MNYAQQHQKKSSYENSFVKTISGADVHCRISYQSPEFIALNDYTKKMSLRFATRTGHVG